MAKKESKLTNMLLSLGIICLICSGLLAVVNQFTEEPIRIANIEKTNRAVAEVVPEFQDIAKSDVECGGTVYEVYTASKGGEVVGYAIKSSSIGFGGPFTIMVGVETATGAIYGTSVISHSETPGLGAKISAKGGFRQQFAGKHPDSFRLGVKKDGAGDVDAITASTITSRAFTKAVKSAYDVYLQLAAAAEAADSQPADETINQN
ncbi:MAG: RnfABCDGE type electron transport complex subunit G [Bacteroidales bacterium]|nr:RnfABCDGE type electron transport complex subunit G [Bacteroidales bacterium]